MPTEIEEIFDSHRQLEEGNRELAENVQYWIGMTQVNKVWERVRARPNKYRSSRVGVCIVDTGYDLNHEDLPKDAVSAGITNDMGSGSQIDLCVISPTEVRYERAVVREESLPTSHGERASDELLRLRNAAAESEEEVVLDGVCGFGSLPFMVNSKRTVLQDNPIKSKRRPTWIDKLVIS